jgi:hypothetical protein
MQTVVKRSRHGVTRVRIALALTLSLGCLLGSLAGTHAQGIDGKLREVCMADYRRFCTGVTPGGGRIKNCMMQNFAQLSEACQQALNTRAAKSKQ